MVPGRLALALGAELEALWEGYQRSGGSGRLKGLGLATVDAPRRAAELQAGAGAMDFRPRPDDLLLGAHVLEAAPTGGPTLRLLEPSTEGRLAAFLARHGEGPVALYVDEVRRPMAADTSGGVPSSVPHPADTSIVAQAGRWGPFLIVSVASRAAAAAGTIAAMPTTEVTMRPAQASDAEALAALLTDEGYPCGPSDILERLPRFDSPYSAVQVAETSGEVVGFVAIHILPRFEHSDRIGRVVALVVDAGARERGLGHRLMAEAERLGAAAGCAFLEVTAGHRRPEAQSLYESVGYEAGVTTYLRKRL